MEKTKLAQSARVIVRRSRMNQGLNGRRQRFHLADSRDSLVGSHADDAVVVRPIEQTDVWIFNSEVNGFDSGDFHDAVSRSEECADVLRAGVNRHGNPFAGAINLRPRLAVHLHAREVLAFGMAQPEPDFLRAE